LVLIVAGLLAYYNSFLAPFIGDDVHSVSENPTIRHLWPVWDALSPPHGRGLTVEGRPALNFSFALNYAVSGVRPWGYHALNLAIHILAGLTLLGIARRTLLRPALSGRFGAESTLLALAIAVIWTLHPLQTEAVTYVAQRAESLMGFFYLLTMYCFIRGVESPKPGRWYALSVGSCLLGMGTKEVMASAPLMVLLYDRTFVAGSFREAGKRRWRLYAGLAGTWLVLGYLVASTRNRGGTAGFGSGISWWEYAATQCRAIVHYLRLSVWPCPLVLDYGTDTVQHVGEIAPYALVLAVLAVGTVLCLWRRNTLGFLGAWLFAILAPSSSVVPVASQTVAEHRMYLPLAAVVATVVLGSANLGQYLLGRWPQTRRLLEWAVSAAVALVLMFLTIQRNQDYKTFLTIWQDTVAKCPNNPRAHNNLGTALAQTGKTEEAIAHYEQALRLKPDYAEALNHLGTVLLQEGKVTDAIRRYEQALRIRPDYAEAHYNLGVALGQTGRIEEAIAHYEQALQLKPDYAEAHNNLGNALAQTGRIEEAIAHYEQTLQLKPDYAEAHYNLGIALARTGKIEEAIAHYEQALKLQPDFAPARNALARLQARQ
jgi:tetratricopeptide (TPR) repeat protein